MITYKYCMVSMPLESYLLSYDLLMLTLLPDIFNFILKISSSLKETEQKSPLHIQHGLHFILGVKAIWEIIFLHWVTLSLIALLFISPFAL